MKQDVRPDTLTAAEKERLNAEVKQLAEILQALRAKKQQRTSPTPDIFSGQPIFTGTRVPIETLFDHLEAGVLLDEFPTVSI